jgi:hypothetical protein
LKSKSLRIANTALNSWAPSKPRLTTATGVVPRFARNVVKTKNSFPNRTQNYIEFAICASPLERTSPLLSFTMIWIRPSRLCLRVLLIGKPSIKHSLPQIILTLKNSKES